MRTEYDKKDAGGRKNKGTWGKNCWVRNTTRKILPPVYLPSYVKPNESQKNRDKLF